jgi:hypothetical protein
MLVISIILSACNPAEGQTQPTSEPTEEPRPPRDFFDLIDEQIQSGSDPGPLIVDNLKILVGELTVENVYGDQDVVFEGTWGLFSIAADYLASGVDESAKAEIRRLIDILAPSQENLDLYAEPAPTSSSGKTGLSAPAHAKPSLQEECQTLWNEGFPTNVDPKPMCLLYQEGTTGKDANGKDYKYKLYYPKEWENDLAKLDMVISVSQAIQDSVKTYQDLGFSVKNMTVLFTLLQSSVGSLAVNPDMVDPCPILIMPAAHTLDEGKFKQTIAHEVFHCVTFHTYGTTEYSTTKWWEESSAAYYSNVVYPAVNHEHRHQGTFDYYSLTTSLLDMSYPNVIFLQYLENFGGTGLVKDFMDYIPKTGSKEQQAVALHNFANMAEILHNFGIAYLDGKITDTGGGAYPVSPKPGIPATIGGQAILTTDSFTLTRYQVLFPQGYEYGVGGGTSEGVGRYSAKPSLSGPDWGELPATVNASCSKNQLTVLMTSIEIGDTYSIDINAVQGQQLACDSCLFGHWMLDVAQQATPFFESKFGQAGMVLNNVSGTWEMFFKQDGTWSHVATDYGITVTQPSDSMTTEFLVTMYGIMYGRFGVSDDKTTLYIWDLDPQMEINTAVFINGEQFGTNLMPINADFMGAAMDFNQGQYVCTQNTLTFFAPPELAPVTQMVFTRQ